MSEVQAPNDVIAFLRGIAAELAEIHRARDYQEWRSEAAPRVDGVLSQVAPFSAFATSWIFTGDGGGALVGGRFGAWAIDRLLEKKTPEDIIVLFEAEVARNAAIYEDVSPVLGIALSEPCDLGGGVRLVPASDDVLSPIDYRWRHSWPNMPSGTGYLVQFYSVTPAFEPRIGKEKDAAGASETLPPSTVRDAVRRRCRLACILGSAGGVALPMSVTLADRQAVLAIDGTSSGRPFDAHPLVAFPADLDTIKRTFAQLASFPDGDALARAVDRLGRSRLAIHPVDRALDLGMAAEIVLMHDQGTSNTEITFKIASRAAWLLGADAAERAAIFEQIKHLYQARSQAVHSGVLSSQSKVDLDVADQLVARVARAILERGGFPDWLALTMGAD